MRAMDYDSHNVCHSSKQWRAWLDCCRSWLILVCIVYLYPYHPKRHFHKMVSLEVWQPWLLISIMVVSRTNSKGPHQGVQWFSGRVLDWRPRGSRYELHLRHCLVSLSKNIYPSFVLVQPRKSLYNWKIVDGM